MIKLRRFSLSDLKEVIEIGGVSFLKRPPYPRSYFLTYYQKYPEGFIVAENRGEIIGYTIGQLKHPATVERVGEFISLAVKPDFQKKGVGTKLTIFLINHFKEKGVKEVSLNVRVRNKIAISFYQNLGFKILKRVENYYRNGDDAYLMRIKI